MTDRRTFLKFLSALSATPLISCGTTSLKSTKRHSVRIAIIGGGAGGATAAKYLKLKDPKLQVTLIEPKQHYYTCFMSNAVIGGSRQLNTIGFSYRNLESIGIKVLHDYAERIDVESKSVHTSNDERIAFDKLIMSPGIALNWNKIEGYNQEVAEQLPHAWQAGEQTAILARQVQTMKKGGTLVITIPPKPFRCPPGPYERASLIASYFKKHNTTAKIILLDANDSFTKQGLFIQGWQQHYGFGTSNSLIEWRPQKEDGTVVRVDAKTMTAFTELDAVKADVMNVIPHQTAAAITEKSGLTDDSKWCPVSSSNFASSYHQDIHIIGDAAIAPPMPKSAFAANSQAKFTAEAILAELNGNSLPEPYLLNTCYSLVTEEHGISITSSYGHKQNKLISLPGTKGTSELNAMASTRALEAQYTQAWYQAITQDMFGPT